MRVHVETHAGTLALEDIPADTTCMDLKQKIWNTFKDSKPDVPPPNEQALVFNGVRLSDPKKPVNSEGVTDGALLVLLKSRSRPSTAEECPPVPERPGLDEIEVAIRSEAERQGRQVTAPTQPPSNHSDRPIHRRLQEVMNALQGLGGDGDAAELQRHMAQVLRQADLMPPIGGIGAAAVPEPPEEVVIPEPDAGHIATLGDMGFSAAAARRALLLNRNQMNTAANYLLAHGGDGDIEAEPTMEELRLVYRARNVRLAAPRVIEPDAQHLEMLSAMGFNDAAANHALVRTDNNVEAAINFLTSVPAGWMPEVAEVQVVGEATAPSADGAPPAAESSPRAANSGEVQPSEASGATAQDVADEPAATEASGSATPPGAADLPSDRRAAAGTEDEGAGEGRDVAAVADEGRERWGDQEGSEERSDSVPSLMSDSNAGDDADGSVGSMPQLAEVSSSDEASGSSISLLNSNVGVAEHGEGQAASGTPTADATAAGAAENGGGGREEGWRVAGEEQLGVMQLEGQALRALALLNPVFGDAMGGGGGVMGSMDGLFNAFNRSMSLDSNGDGRMLGAMPILSTGGGADGNVMDPFQLGEDMRWTEAMPATMDGFGLHGELPDDSDELNGDYGDESDEDDSDEDSDDDDDDDDDDDEEDDDNDDESGDSGVHLELE